MKRKTERTYNLQCLDGRCNLKRANSSRAAAQVNDLILEFFRSEWLPSTFPFGANANASALKLRNFFPMVHEKLRLKTVNNLQSLDLTFIKFHDRILNMAWRKKYNWSAFLLCYVTSWQRTTGQCHAATCRKLSKPTRNEMRASAEMATS